MLRQAEGVPELIILDLKLPKISGLEILRKMRADEQFKNVPVVIFSSSVDEMDKEKSFYYGASEFMTKPIDFDAFRNTITRMTRTYLNPGRNIRPDSTSCMERKIFDIRE
ncbi:MAG: response regulator [Desulfobulbaceae bacterium]|nr:response regulator [Desulfobulbaceae bacterium]